MPKLLSAFAAILLLCAAAMPLAAAPAAGSVEPTSTEPAATEESKPAETKKAKKATVRKHRYARKRYRYRSQAFVFPRIFVDFRWPRYRYHRGHRRSYAGFPFFFRVRW